MLGRDSSRVGYTGQNKRKNNRVAPSTNESAGLYVRGKRYEGELLDESNGGLGILLHQPLQLKKGCRVRIAARRRCSEAIVVRCFESDAGCVVGLKV